MANPTTKRRLSPEAVKYLPYDDFPLSPHLPTGRWYKVIRGKRHYFGKLADGHEQALATYNAQKADLHAGRTPRPRNGELTVRELANRFLTARKRKLEAGEMKPKTFGQYYASAGIVVDVFGADRPVDDLTADDFGHLRAELAKGRGVHDLGNHVRRIRGMFKYGYDAGLLDRPMRYGPEFVHPGPRELRRARADAGPRTLEPGQIRDVLARASVPMRAMILLGINCAYGNNDCAELPLSAVDLDAGVLAWRRPKTGVERRCPLWVETIEALRKAIEARPRPRAKADAGLLFITSHGRRWVRYQFEEATQDEGGEVKEARTRGSDAVGMTFGRLLREAGHKRAGINFYALRHTFRTVADEVNDRPAIDLIMGHEPSGDIATHYRHRIDDDRLRRVTNHVRLWLWPEKASKKTQRKAAKKKPGAGKKKGARKNWSRR